MRLFWQAFWITIVVLGCYFLSMYLANCYDCHVAWRDSGLEYRYTMRAGCQIYKDTGWFPASSYRFE